MSAAFGSEMFGHKLVAVPEEGSRLSRDTMSTNLHSLHLLLRESTQSRTLENSQSDKHSEAKVCIEEAYLGR
jgi:hypothetical protein